MAHTTAPPQVVASRGFSLVELMVALVVLALLLGLAAPSFGLWVQNAKTRTATDSLQNGLRQAQAEALRLHRQTVLFRSASGNCDNGNTADAAGSYWVLRSVPRMAGDTVNTLQCGQLMETGDGLVIHGPVALCFNGIGRMAANTDPGLGVTACTVPAEGSAQFNISHPKGDRPLRVVVGINGNARTCDPSRSLAANQPDGCP